MRAETIISTVRLVTKTWAKQRKAEERQASRESRRYSVLSRSRERVTLKEAAESVMEAAYLKASSNGELPATARQVMYAARGPIQEQTGEMLDDKYFTQTLLPNYLRDHPQTTANWDIVFDARGHFHEPHTRTVVPLGTLAVRHYLAEKHDAGAIPDYSIAPLVTQGPGLRYGAILFIEKEGFLPLLERAQIAERFDVAIMSTKGMSVTAARLLVDRLCGEHGFPLLVLHDFDKAGFSILGGFTRSNDRYRFQHCVNVIDLGLRLADVQEHDLPSESFAISRLGSRAKFRSNLRRNGAREQEIDFLSQGQRVELNAMDAGQLITWIEGKLLAHGVKKVVPDLDVLAQTYRKSLRQKYVQERLDELRAEAQRVSDQARVPKSLEKKVRRMLEGDNTRPWDWAVREIASKD